MIKKHIKRVLLLTFASIFLILGLLGLVLPILQGWLFLAISALLFSAYSPAFRGWMDERTVKYPKIHSALQKADTWVVRVFGAPEAD